MDSNEYKYEKKLVAFVDILGFRKKTDNVEGYAKKPVHMMLSEIKRYKKSMRKQV